MAMAITPIVVSIICFLPVLSAAHYFFAPQVALAGQA
jgi:hypothetical protein